MILYDLLKLAQKDTQFEVYKIDPAGKAAHVGYGTRRELMDENREGNAVNYLDREVALWYVAWNGRLVVKLVAGKSELEPGSGNGQDAVPAAFGADGIARLPEAAIHELMAGNKHNLSDESDMYARGYHDALLDIMEAAGIKTDEKHFD